MSSSSTASSRGTSDGGTARRPAGRAALPGRLFVFSLLAYLLLGSGLIASSDGLTMYTLAESMLAGRLAIPEGNGKIGRDGLLYAKADPGQAVIALPLVAAGRASAALLPPGALRALWPRSLASTLNAFAGAAAVLAFFSLLTALGYPTRSSLVLCLGLAFATPLLPYAKSFLREPLLMLCMTAAFLALRRHAAAAASGNALFARSREPLAAGLWLGAGMVIKASLALNVPLLLAYLMATTRQHPGCRRAILSFLAGPAAGAALLALYNAHRFGNPMTSGYDPTVDNFSTPLLVGLYGQLLSSGKSIFLYAPLGIAALFALPAFARRHRAEAATALAIFTANVVFHAKFASWAGEGSWGPRYIVPFLPFLLLPAIELAAAADRARRRAAALALALGLLVQIGGTAIYYGSYMRDLGEYPYERNFSDPLFMVRSHFVPNYSPLVGHWRLLNRNAALLLDPALRPQLTPRTDVAGRLPLAAADREELRYVVDFWFCYLLYARMPAALILVPLAALLALTLGAGVGLARAARAAPGQGFDEAAPRHPAGPR